jgi:hypothetical protein
MIVESNHTFFEALEDLGRGVFNNNREKKTTILILPTTSFRLPSNDNKALEIRSIFNNKKKLRIPRLIARAWGL